MGSKYQKIKGNQQTIQFHLNDVMSLHVDEGGNEEGNQRGNMRGNTTPGNQGGNQR